MRRILWNGDAVAATGFEKVTSHVLDVLRRTCKVGVLGINYNGDPRLDGDLEFAPYPYPIWPCVPGGDAFGLGRIEELYRKFKPDVLILQNDPWNVRDYLEEFPEERTKIPVIAYMPVDGKNCQGRPLNGLRLGIFYTDFALREARAGGFTGAGCVVPLGVDLDVFKPMDKHAAREALGFYKKNPANGKPFIPRDAFVVGNVNRNQPRKRIDLTVAYFAEWVKRRNLDNAWLYLHLAPTADQGWDTQQLANYYGVGDRIIYTSRRFELGVGIAEARMRGVYGAFDAQISTTQGEGFGLTTLEGMACGVPQLVPDWSALGDWIPDGAALKAPCSEIAVTPMSINVIGGVPDRAWMVDALDRLHDDDAERARLSAAGLALAADQKFRWEAIGTAFAAAVDGAMAPVPIRAAAREPEVVGAPA